MGIGDKAKNKAEELAGKAKEELGKATGNDDLKREGETEQTKAKAKEVAAKGLPAGILDSDKYASLEPGSWLVYIGEFDSSKQAEKAAAKYENAGYPGEPTFVGQTETPESDSSGSGSTQP